MWRCRFIGDFQYAATFSVWNLLDPKTWCVGEEGHCLLLLRCHFVDTSMATRMGSAVIAPSGAGPTPLVVPQGLCLRGTMTTASVPNRPMPWPGGDAAPSGLLYSGPVLFRPRPVYRRFQVGRWSQRGGFPSSSNIRRCFCQISHVALESDHVTLAIMLMVKKFTKFQAANLP